MKQEKQITKVSCPALKEGGDVCKALSHKEREVMRCFVSGLTAYSTAVELGVSPHTIDTYARRIYAKFGVHSRAAAVAIYVQSNISQPSSV